MIFYLEFPLRCRQADIVATVLSPMSLTPVINYCRCCCYRQKSHICCHGIDENLSNHKCQPHQQIIYCQYETSNNLSRVSLTPVYSFSPVLLTPPAINTKLRISPWMFVKICNGPSGILRDPGETDSWTTTWSRKSRIRLSLICVAVSNKHVLVDFKQQYYYSIEPAFIIKLSGMLYVHMLCSLWCSSYLDSFICLLA